MALDLRPLTLAELLDRSFSIYKQHLWLFVGIMSVPAALALVAAVLLRVFNNGFRPGMPPDQVFRQMVPLFIASFIFLFVYMLVYMIAIGAMTIAVSQIYLDREITASAAYQGVRKSGGRLMALFIISLLRLVGTWFGLTIVSSILAGLLALLTPILSVGVLFLGFLASSVLVGFMAVRYGVALPVVVLEEATASEALRRSVELTKGHLGRVFLLILCATMIAYATAAICQGPFLLGSMLAGPGTWLSLVLGVMGAVVGAIGGMFSGPLMIIGLAMIYYDLRIRKEALDLHVMLESLDAAPRS